jgi:prepilin-type N-terminal cleavage/methylation domain-containing protein
MMKWVTKKNQSGFTIVELVISLVVFPLIVIGVSNAFNVVSKTYQRARQLNEMYAVLSACPEIDRALQYDIVTSLTNCYPNNVFKAENGSTNTFTYTPTLTVTPAVQLQSSDPLYNIPDSKVIDVNVGFIDNTGSPLRLRLLISRNGISQQ